MGKVRGFIAPPTVVICDNLRPPPPRRPPPGLLRMCIRILEMLPPAVRTVCGFAYRHVTSSVTYIVHIVTHALLPREVQPERRRPRWRIAGGGSGGTCVVQWILCFVERMCSRKDGDVSRSPRPWTVPGAPIAPEPSERRSQRPKIKKKIACPHLACMSCVFLQCRRQLRGNSYDEGDGVLYGPGRMAAPGRL